MFIPYSDYLFISTMYFFFVFVFMIKLAMIVYIYDDFNIRLDVLIYISKFWHEGIWILSYGRQNCISSIPTCFILFFFYIFAIHLWFVNELNAFWIFISNFFILLYRKINFIRRVGAFFSVLYLISCGDIIVLLNYS